VRSYVLSLTGRDRPGIVSAVTRALLDRAVNIEDSEMAILRGHFAVMLVLSAPDDVDEAALRADLDRAREELPLETVALAELAAVEPRAAEASHAISVYGADHPGIVHGVAAALARLGVNVVGMSTRVVGEDEGEALYVMLLDVTLPAGLDEATLEATLGDVARAQGVDVSVRPVDGDVL
jgi:glycine cleavage system transcriptional repressor